MAVDAKIDKLQSQSAIMGTIPDTIALNRHDINRKYPGRSLSAKFV
jgi:hypothetical protein